MASKAALHDKVFQNDPPRPRQTLSLGQLIDGYGYALAAPLRSLSESLSRKDIERTMPR
jgi:hypothetical protein